MRTLDDSTKRSYGQLSRQDRDGFRARWATARLKAAQATKFACKEASSTVNAARGTYYPFSKVLEEEGGMNGPMGIHNLRAALRYWRRAVAQGGRWCRYNSWTARGEVLYVRQHLDEVHDKTHSVEDGYTEVKDAIQAIADAPPKPENPEESNDPAPAQAVGKRKAKSGAKAKPEPSSGGKEPNQKRGRVEDQDKHQFREATALRTTWLATVGSARSLLVTAKEDPAWAWSHNTVFLKKIEDALSDAEKAASADPFARAFLSQEPGAVKKSHEGTDDGSWQAGLKRFLDLQEVLDNLKEHAATMQQVHKCTVGKR